MKYVLSSLLVTTDPSSGVIQSSQSGQRFEVTDEVLKLLKCFSEPCTIEDALSLIRTTRTEKLKVRKFLELLCSNRLLVPYPESEPASGASMLALTNKALVQSTQKTFLSCPSGALPSIGQDDIVFLGVPFDLGTTGFPGARFGPDRMRDISSDAFEYHADIFSGTCRGWFSLERDRYVLKDRRIIDVGNVILQVGEGFDQFFDRIGKTVDQILRKGAFPVMIGGDHSCSYPSIRSFKKRYGDIGVIHIDAHPDLGDLLPGIPNNHGNVFTRVLDESLVVHLYQFGVHGMIRKRFCDSRYSLFPLRQLMEGGGVERAVARIDTRFSYYLSIDIDVLDPAYAPGTGTPVHRGMTAEGLYTLLSYIISKVNILGFDVMEVNPMLDRGNQTLDIANAIVLHILAEIEQRRLQTRPTV